MGPETYTASAVCEAAGIKTTTLRAWRSRGIVNVAKDAEADWTRYSDADLMRVCVLAELGRSGMDLALAAPIVEGLDFERPADRVSDPLLLAATIGRGGATVKTGGNVRWSRSRRVEIEESSDLVTIVVDVAKILERARAALGSAR